MPTLIKQQNQLWTKAFICLFILNFCQFISFHMQVSTFSFFIKSLGGSDMIAGLASGMFSISALFARPFSGWLFDHTNKKKIFFIGVTGLILLPLSYSLLKIIGLLVFLRIIHGAFWSLSSTAVNCEVVGIIPRHRFGEGMGYFGVTAALSMSISPALGLLLMNRFGFTSMFLLAAFMAVLALFFTFVYGVKNTPHQLTITKSPHKNLLQRLSSLFHKDALPASVVLFFCLIPHGAIMTFVALYAVANHIGSGSAFFVIMALATIAVRLVIGKLSDTKGESGIVYTSCTCIFICMLLLGIFPGKIAFYIGALFFGAGFGMITPAMQAMALRIVPTENRGSATSTYLCAFDLGIGLGGILGGILVTTLGTYAHMYL
ncbi:MAG: MFS transporter, partial [Clostridiales bacterium]